MARKKKKIEENDTEYPKGGISQYPNTKLIGDAVWSIKFVRVIEQKSAFGMCDPQTRGIFLEMGQSRRETMNTFMHEILHAIELEYDIKLKHSTLDKLSIALVDLLVENHVAWHRIIHGD